MTPSRRPRDTPPTRTARRANDPASRAKWLLARTERVRGRGRRTMATRAWPIAGKRAIGSARASRASSSLARARSRPAVARRDVRRRAWGTRTRRGERRERPGLDEGYYENLAYREESRGREGSADDGDACPLDLHASRASDFEAIMLVVGTTVGGGFLAMPYFAAPAGFVPAALVSAGAWAVLAASGLLVAETLVHTWARSSGRAVSLLSATNDYLGKKWGAMAAVSFFVLMNCTLVSQLAKCGQLASVFSNGAVSHVAGAAMTAGLIGFAAFSKSAAKINAVATVGIFASFAVICATGSTTLALNKLAFMNFAATLPALPGLFQLFTYGECLPTLVDMLRGDRERIRKVILLGTSVPLFMYVAWMIVALAQTGAWEGSNDLAQTMLESGGLLGNATAAVAITASVSTLIGGYLALSRFCADALKKKTVSGSKSVIALTLIPSLLFAFKGPEVYFSAIHFSGAVVVVILWGILPPLLSKSLWMREGKFHGQRKILVNVWTSIASVALFFGVKSVVTM